MIPRIKGKVGQAIDGPHPGKWYFSIWVTDIEDDRRQLPQSEAVRTVGPWETEREAQENLMKGARIAAEELEKKFSPDGSLSGKYFDMKAGKLRRWEDRT